LFAKLTLGPSRLPQLPRGRDRAHANADWALVCLGSPLHELHGVDIIAPSALGPVVVQRNAERLGQLQHLATSPAEACDPQQVLLKLHAREGSAVPVHGVDRVPLRGPPPKNHRRTPTSVGVTWIVVPNMLMTHATAKMATTPNIP
jgi:hypothetical protein